MTGPDSIYDETRTPYDNLERVLRARGYRLAGENDDVTLVTGLGVCGAFAPPHSPNERFANRFLADHSEAFNKWSQVPVAVTLPTTQEIGRAHV